MTIHGDANDPKLTPVYPSALDCFDNQLLGYVRLSSLTPNLMYTNSRILLIGNYSSVKNSTFALEHVPTTDVDWGTRRTLNNSSSLLCHGRSQTPITLWFVGRLLEFNFERNAEPAEMVGVSIDPLTQGTANEAQTFLSKLCMPSTSTLPPTPPNLIVTSRRIRGFVGRCHRYMLPGNVSRTRGNQTSTVHRRL